MARIFMIKPETITRWMKKAGDDQDGLFQFFQPVNKYPYYVRDSIHRLKTLCPTMGKVRTAHVERKRKFYDINQVRLNASNNSSL
jgi:hypothetical protein